jgi:GntR family transcriptional regulator
MQYNGEGIMIIVIKNRSELPIYEQIKQQMKAQILDGTLREDEQLPSIRQLARDLKISVITTTRVYNDLLDEGFITSMSGKGYYVAPRNNELLRERMLFEMEDGLQKAVENGRNAGLTDDEIAAALRKFMEG